MIDSNNLEYFSQSLQDNNFCVIFNFENAINCFCNWSIPQYYFCKGYCDYFGIIAKNYKEDYLQHFIIERKGVPKKLPPTGGLFMMQEIFEDGSFGLFEKIEVNVFDSRDNFPLFYKQIKLLITTLKDKNCVAIVGVNGGSHVVTLFCCENKFYWKDTNKEGVEEVDCCDLIPILKEYKMVDLMIVEKIESHKDL